MKQNLSVNVLEAFAAAATVAASVIVLFIKISHRGMAVSVYLMRIPR